MPICSRISWMLQVERWYKRLRRYVPRCILISVLGFANPLRVQRCCAGIRGKTCDVLFASQRLQEWRFMLISVLARLRWPDKVVWLRMLVFRASYASPVATVSGNWGDFRCVTFLLYPCHQNSQFGSHACTVIIIRILRLIHTQAQVWADILFLSGACI